MIGSHGLVEVKKLHNRDQESLDDTLLRQHICKGKSGNLTLNKNHSYYYQVQQQLLCSGRSWGDFAASDGNSIFIERVVYDENFWSEKIQHLEKFYNNMILLELAYPRIKHGLDRIGKAGITYESLIAEY